MSVDRHSVARSGLVIVLIVMHVALGCRSAPVETPLADEVPGAAATAEAPAAAEQSGGEVDSRAAGAYEPAERSSSGLSAAEEGSEGADEAPSQAGAADAGVDIAELGIGGFVFVYGGDLWLLRGGEAPRQLTIDGWASQPVPSPDGQRVAYLSVPEEDRPTDIWSGILPHELWLVESDTVSTIRVSTPGAEPGVPAWDYESGALVWGEDDRLMRRSAEGVVEVLEEGLEPLAYGTRGSVHPAVSRHGYGIVWDECGETSCYLKLRRSGGEIVVVAESEGLVPYQYVWVETTALAIDGAQAPGEAEQIAWTTFETGPEVGPWTVFDPTSGASRSLRAALALSGGAAGAITFETDGRLRIVDLAAPEAPGIAISPAPRPLPSSFLDVTWVTGATGPRGDPEGVVYRVVDHSDEAGLYAARLPQSRAQQIHELSRQEDLTESEDGRPRGLGVARRFVLIEADL